MDSDGVYIFTHQNGSARNNPIYIGKTTVLRMATSGMSRDYTVRPLVDINE